MNLMNGKSTNIPHQGPRSGSGVRYILGKQSATMWKQGVSVTEERVNHIKLSIVVGSHLCFTKDWENIHAHLCKDHKTAVFYVNCMGGTCPPTIRATNYLALVVVPTGCLPEVDNRIAHKESRSFSHQQNGKYTWQYSSRWWQHSIVSNRPLCVTAERLAEAVCQLETRPRDRCSTAAMRQRDNLCLSSIQFNRQMPQEGQGSTLFCIE